MRRDDEDAIHVVITQHAAVTRGDKALSSSCQDANSSFQVKDAQIKDDVVGWFYLQRLQIPNFVEKIISD